MRTYRKKEALMSKPFSPLSRLLGTPIVDVRGMAVGHVIDILVDTKDGRVAYVQLSLEDEFERQTSKITVPWSSLHASSLANTALQLRVGKSALAALGVARSHRLPAQSVSKAARQV
jgi:sporulation protein YlmC with PRC-barrel domain